MAKGREYIGAPLGGGRQCRGRFSRVSTCSFVASRSRSRLCEGSGVATSVTVMG